MKILIISATANEVEFKVKSHIKSGIPVAITDSFNHQVDLLVTGIGAVPTAFFTARFAEQYQLVINIGIAGSYSKNIPYGSVVCVKTDTFGDYGIDDRGKFSSLLKNKLLDENELPFQGGVLVNPYLNEKIKLQELQMANGITVATVSGSEERITQLREMWNPDIETMESAAVFYVCNMLEIPFICFRSISNMVEPRDRSKWEIKKAINNLNSFTKHFIDHLPSSI